MGSSREIRSGTRAAERLAPEAALRARDDLDGAREIDARRIAVVARGDSLALRGWVSSPEEAQVAVAIAERAAGDGGVDDELQIDPGLREGALDAIVVEHAVAADGEVLIGDTDMLAGPESHITSDMDRALAEGEPWDPPEFATLPPEAEPGRAGGGGGVRLVREDDDEDEIVLLPRDDVPAAADVSRLELRRARSGADLPGLDSEAAPPIAGVQPTRTGVDSFGSAPDDETAAEEMVGQEPGTEPGPGAIGEHALRGGLDGSIPATETGARGVDTRHADPARSATGTTAKQAGTDRGPPSREDEAIREDFPEED
jgi:hypothetical protein